MSRQRDDILNVIKCSDKHLSAEEIFMLLKSEGKNISIATVYRNLGILADKGIIKKISVGDGVDRYDRTIKAHDHLVCDRCGAISDVSIEGLKAYLEEKCGETLFSYDLCMHYVCSKCMKSKA